MRLSSKYILFASLLMGGVLLVGLHSIFNLLEMKRVLQASIAEYQIMDFSESMIAKVAWLRDVLRGENARTYSDASYFAPIQLELDKLDSAIPTSVKMDDGDSKNLTDLHDNVTSHFKKAIELAENKSPAKSASELETVRANLNTIYQLAPAAVRHHAIASEIRISHHLAWSCFWLLVVLAVSTAIHVSQFRGLVRPLYWLKNDMSKCAKNDYKELIAERGDEEFRAIAGKFNGLASELAKLFRSLEEKIIQRSRELVRSERLSSVGFLAAGVAHEINNPLGIISGYAELAINGLKRVMEADMVTREPDDIAELEARELGEVMDAQVIIREEAFRCTEITSRLLALARGGTGGRQELNLAEVARQVALLVKGLRNYRERKVTIRLSRDEFLPIQANATEMKQVLLNLTINALEAIPLVNGEVIIWGRKRDGWIELAVEDNGKGMSQEMLEQVFEPFFTGRKGGTGLGLYIARELCQLNRSVLLYEARTQRI